MEGERWQRIERLFHVAMPLDKRQREALLDRSCADDESLRSEVASLLAHADEASSFLERPAFALLAGDTPSGSAPPVSGIGEFPMLPSHSHSIAELTGSFPPTPRFELRHCLGAGGFGIVYEAYDREFNDVVALKALRRGGPGSHYSFKKEFRALGDIIHPNLIALYELIVGGDQCFFTMELVRGKHFLQYVREFNSLNTAAATLDAGRLKDCFRQLAEGVYALHQAGKLHCDLKPSNVLVDEAGRLVILDFGLITSNDSAAILARRPGLAGTPQYMSPEQLNGSRLAEASDWYSAGVMLCEALTGHQLFSGSLREIVEQKRLFAPPVPVFGGDIPAELSELCGRLLARAPEQRPAGKEILQMLGSQKGHGRTPVSSHMDSRVPLIGREPELAILRDCLRRAAKNLMTTILVHGPSGVGKTALVQHFLSGLGRTDGQVVLYGRCFEQEAVPYNAIDALVECLDSYMKSLPASEAAERLPSGLGALKTLFPLIKESGWANYLESAAAAESLELRKQGITAFCEIVRNIANTATVIIFIDDLQRGDADSAAVLNELIAGCDRSCILLIGCYRSEEAHSSPLLSRLQPLHEGDRQESLVKLGLAELNDSNARRLAAALLQQDGAPPSIQSEIIAREAKGHPLFIGELVRYFRAGIADTSCPGESAELLSLNDVIRSRTLSLPPKARRLLEIIAVGGQPIGTSLACRAAEIGEGGQAELHLLRAMNLLRTRKTEAASQVEAYHDRIQEVVQSSLDANALRQAHYHLAVEHERSVQPDPRIVATHFLGGGLPLRALPYAIAAAEKARAVLAFAAASDAYRLALHALELLPEGTERDSQELAVRQALVTMLQLTRGWGAAEILETVNRGIALAEKSADPRQFASWIGSQAFTAWIAADLSTSLALTDQALELQLRQQNGTAIPYLYVQQLMTRFWLGDHAGAEISLLTGSPYFADPKFKRNVVGSVIALFAYSSWNAWMLGRADLARERLQELIKAINVNNPHDLVFAGHHAALVLCDLGQFAQAETVALWASQLAKQHQFPNEAAMAQAALGLTRTRLAHRSDAAVLLREGIAGMVQSGQRLGNALYTQSLAVALAQAGDFSEALKTIEYALSANFNEPVFRPEGLRLRAELHAQTGETRLAEDGLLEAIALARANHARAAELRAALTLARLWRGTSRAQKGREELSAVYDSFAEGFDTVDLQEAKAFLNGT